MNQLKRKPTHTVMSHELAKALMASGMQHFDVGGMVAPVMAPQAAPSSSGSGLEAGSLIGMSGYNAQLAPTQQTNYGGVINTAAGNVGEGYGRSQDIQGQQQNLANTLLAQSQGQGPNPAQAALNQATGQNAAMQAALMASQRGSGANVGMMARQAAQQGGALQQQAAGQSAVMQAQQQLGAQNALQNQQQAMQSANLGQQGVQAGMFGTAAGAQNAQNNSNIANYKMAQDINSGVAQKNADATGKAVGGLLGGIGSVAGALFSKGGEVPEHLHAMASIYHPEYAKDFRSGGPVPGRAQVQGDSEKNDTVPAMLSPGEQVLPRSVTQSANAPEKAAEFVRHLQDIEMKKGKGGGYEAVARAKGSLKDRVEKLEALWKGGAA